MSRIFETVFGWLLGAITFFDNIRTRRGDDEVTARYKQLQRSCVWGTVLPFVIAIGGFLVGNLLDAFDAMFQHAASLANLRSTAFFVVMGAFAGAVAYGAFCYWRLWRFENGDDDFV